MLIDALVRQTMVLIATLATGAGQRPSISHIADLVFADLVRALKEQGVTNKVIADMFGLALRTYHKRVAQLSESQTFGGQTLWAAVYDHVQQSGPVLRAEIFHRFARDSEAMIGAVLKDLVDNGLVYRSGRGNQTSYRLRDEVEAGRQALDAAQRERMLLVAIHRAGTITRAEVQTLLPALEPDALQAGLGHLLDQGLVRMVTTADGEHFECERCTIPFGDDAGWEAAVFDHYQAMVAALLAKLRGGARSAALGDQIGGSTFVFDLWHGHPLEAEARRFLREARERGLSLRDRLDALQPTAPVDRRPLRVVAYVGQTVTDTGGDDDSDEL